MHRFARPRQDWNILAPLGMIAAVFCSQGPLRAADEESPSAAPRNTEAEITFERDVRPIFAGKCLGCHGAQTQKAELDLSTPAGVRRGGESGAFLAAETPEESLLYEMVHSGLMPPEEKDHLSKPQIEIIRGWLAAGAKFAEPSNDEAASTPAITDHDVIPILLRRCVMCHGQDLQQGELDLRTTAAILRGGKSGPALVAGQPEQSRMISRVKQHKCPPAGDLSQAAIEPMTADELQTLTEWIARGALEADVETASDDGDDRLITDTDRQFWSFQPPRKWSPPDVAAQHRVRNPIDAFLLARLEAAGLSFSPEADKLTLLRRATFNLTGLPPEPQDVAAFLSDDDPHAYERLIDRLLESPRYGERWAQFWLDLAGYADSEGKRHADTVRPWAWRYRDYVIRAFNDDLPYDQFLVEQLAGDELVDYSDPDAVTDDVIQKLVATGFLRMAPDGTAANPVNRFPDRIEVISDEVDVLARGVMGLTMKCAQCHSHKYDPLPQRDYYRFAAIFKGAYDEYNWMVPQPFGNQWKHALPRYLTVLTPQERREIEEHNAPLQAQIEQLEHEKNNADPQRVKELENELKGLADRLRQPPQIRALWDRGQPSPAYIYRRGDETQPVRMVHPDVPSVLKTAGAPFSSDGTPLTIEADAAALQNKTGRRLALARWLTQPRHPLTARVFVNRIWFQHFGRGIVASLDDFGALGTPPTHPDLLDWLAVEFVEQGWSLKKLHRLIMTSAAYRQAAVVRPEHERLDPDNILLSRMPMRRMTAEEVRDSILLLAGKLDERRFGPPDPVEVRSDGLVTSKPNQGMWRRSVYVRHRRKEMPTLLETFDLPQMNPNCLERKPSTVVSQPLHLLNNRMIYELAAALAARISAEAGTADSESLLDTAWRLVLNRPPTGEELQVGRAALAELTVRWQQHSGGATNDSDPELQALADLSHALLNSAAFLYID